MEGDEVGVGALIGKQVLDYIDGARYLVIERCTQCPCNVLDEGHVCVKFNPARSTGLCSDPIPNWCPLPVLE